MVFRATALFLVLGFLVVVPAQALRFYVDGSPALNDTTPPKGDDRRSVQSAQNDSTPFRTITHALRVAHLVKEGRPHVISVERGTYSPSRGETFPLVFTEPDIYISTRGLTIFDAEGMSNFFHLTGSTSDFVISGIDFINGRAPQGGAIYARSCSLRVVDSRFFNNQATRNGHVAYVRNGRLKFINNVVRNSGSSTESIGVIETHNVFPDTVNRDEIRNNTFYRNPSPNIRSSSTRTDINSNIFLGEATLLDVAAEADPMVRYNLFWEADILYISDKGDTIGVHRTVLDTLTFSEVGISVPPFMTNSPPVKKLTSVGDTLTFEELGIMIPPLVTNIPDTLATAGQLYTHTIEVEGDPSEFSFESLTLPPGASTTGSRSIEWRPTFNDTGSHAVVVEIEDPEGRVDSLDYYITVYSGQNFPDTTGFLAVRDATGRIIGQARARSKVEVPITVGDLHSFRIEVKGNRSAYDFNPLILPIGASREDVDNLGEIHWTPTIADTGSNQVRVEIIDPTGDLGFLNYNVSVFTPETFPDTTAKGPIVRSTVVRDTTAAIEALNALVPSFSKPDSAIDNLFADPAFLDTTINRFELLNHSPARHAGDPATLLRNRFGGRNHIGSEGGPVNPGSRHPGTFLELDIVNMPDSLAVEGQAYEYDPILDPSARISLVDLTQGPPSMFKAFGKLPPITWTPTLADTGTYLVGVKVFTNSGQGRQYYPLRVRPLNESPVFTSEPAPIAFEDSLYSYSLAATDEDGDAITFSLTSGPEGMKVDSRTGLLQWLPTQSDVGSISIRIKVDDGKGGTSYQQFTLEVLDTNDPPLITSTPDSTATEDSPYKYVMEATDPDPADTLSYSLVSGPSTISIDSLGVMRWTPPQSEVGAQTITLRVSDRRGGTADQNFRVVVSQVDDPPEIVSQPGTTATEDLLYRYDFQANDEEGGTLSYALSVAPEDMRIDTTGSVEWTPTAADTGLHAIRIEVADPAGQTAVQSFDLRVLWVNDPPLIVSRSPGDSIFVTDPGAETDFVVSVSDEEGDPLTYTWTLNNVPQQGTSDTSLTFQPSTTGVDTLTFLAADPAGTTAVSWFVDGRRIPRISLPTETVRFGEVALSDTVKMALEITNSGHLDLEITSFQVGNLQFVATFGTSVISPGTSTTLELSYIPSRRGPTDSSIGFATNDPDNPSVRIPLRGAGVIPTRLALDLDPDPGLQALQDTTLAPGAGVSLTFFVEEALQLVSFELLLSFDPTIFNLAGFAADGPGEDNLLKSGGNSVLPSAATPMDTLLQVGARTQEGAQGVSGDGLLGVLSLVVDPAVVARGQTSSIRLVEARLQSSDQSNPDTLRPGSTVRFGIRPALVSDFNYDNVVDFEDFFLFADQFGTTPDSPNWDSRFDINQDGASLNRVDFEDFFVFAEQFGSAAAKPLAAQVASSRHLLLQTVPASGDLDRARFELLWQGSPTPRGYAIALEYDPEVLRFDEFQPRPAHDPLPMIRHDDSGLLVFAAGLASGQPPFQGDDLGVLVFERLSTGTTTLRSSGALAYTQGRTTELAAPPSVVLEELPSTYVLFPAFPNPFNPQTTVSFFLPEESKVRLRVYDLLGRPVRNLAAGRLSAGYHTLTWKGRNEFGRTVAAGVYLLELRARDFRQVRKLLLLK